MRNLQVRSIISLAIFHFVFVLIIVGLVSIVLGLFSIATAIIEAWLNNLLGFDASSLVEVSLSVLVGVMISTQVMGKRVVIKEPRKLAVFSTVCLLLLLIGLLSAEFLTEGFFPMQLGFWIYIVAGVISFYVFSEIFLRQQSKKQLISLSETPSLRP